MKFVLFIFCIVLCSSNLIGQINIITGDNIRSVKSTKYDTSQSLRVIQLSQLFEVSQQASSVKDEFAVSKTFSGKSKIKKSGVEQTHFGKRSAAPLLASFDGLG